MQIAPLPATEAERLAALQALDVLDTEPQAELDALIRVAATVCGVPISLISLVDENRQWFKANIGLPGVSQTPRDSAFCAHAILQDDVMEVPDALADIRFVDNPLVVGKPDIRFYAGAPIRVSSGAHVGTLCVIDRTPKTLTAVQRAVLKDLALAAAAVLEHRAQAKLIECAQKELVESAQAKLRLAAIIEHSDDAIISKDLQSRVVTWNQSAERLFGYSSTEMVGQPITRLLPEDRLGEERDLIAQLHQGLPVSNFETLRQHKNGRSLHVSVSLSPILDDSGQVIGISKIVRDISEHIATQAALAARTAEYKTLIDSLFEGVVLQRQDGMIVSCNPSAEAMLGLSFEQMIGKKSVDPSWRCIHEDFSPYPGQTHPSMRALASGQEIKSDLMGVYKPDGSLTWIMVNARPLFEGNASQPTGVVCSFNDVTQGRAALAAQRESELRWQTLTTVVPVGIFETDAQGACTYTNPQWQSIYGLTLEQSLGDGWSKPMHPDDKDAVYAQWLRTAAVGQEFDMEFRVRHADGDIRKVHSRARPQYDEAFKLTGFVGSVEDITQSAEAADRILKLSRRLEMATEAAGVGIWEWDVVSDAVIWDERMYALYWTEPQDSVPLFSYWRSLIDPTDLARTDALAVAALRGEAIYDTQFRVQGPGGQRRVIRAVATRELDAQGKPQRMVGLNIDVSEQAAQEETLKLARDMAEQASLSKSQFLANMSHEIRTPMNAVIGMTYLLGTTALAPEQRRYADMIRASAQNLLGLINDILDFSKIEAGRLELNPVNFSLDELMSALAASMSITVGEKPLELAIGVAPDVPGYLVADALRIQQVLINLTSNAIKFTERGQVSVEVRLLSHSSAQMTLQCEVRDTGIGLSKAQIGQLFKPFSQADASITRRFGGTGLGLSICRELVEMMGGTVSVVSEPGVGSCFTFSLQCDAGTRPSAGASAMVPGNYRALVVDDNATSRGYLLQTLRSWGWQCTEADTAASALAAVDAHRQLGAGFDVVLLDWVMPGMEELVEVVGLQRGAQGQAVPLVAMLNAHARALMAQDDYLATTGGCLIKPFTNSNLVTVLREALQPSTASVQKAKGAASAAGTLKGFCYLLVDDNAMNLAVGQGILEHAGATVDVAKNGEEALQMLAAHGSKYAVVLMDVQMPVMDGLTATRTLRSELNLNLPVLAMTAGVMASERAACLEAGMNDLIGKPLDVASMLALVATYSDRQHRAGDAPVAAPAAVNQAGASLTVFDPEPMLAATGNSAATRAAVVLACKNLIAEQTTALTQVQEHLNAGQSQLAARLLHGLRGGLGSMGARAFGAGALALENAIRADAAADHTELLAQCTEQLQAVVQHAQAWLALQSQSVAVPKLAQGPLALAIERLAVALAAQDMNAMVEYASLQTELDALLPAEAAAELAQAMGDLDFDAALLVLRAQGLGVA